MAKLTKSALKGLVKECLVEILSEGISGMSGDSTEIFSKKRTSSKTQIEKRRSEEMKRLAEHRQKFEVKVDDAVSQLTDDPIMQSIFADTARSTLQEQISHDQKPGRASQVSPESLSGNASGIDLGSIFEGASSNWSHLAFSEKKGQ